MVEMKDMNILLWIYENTVWLITSLGNTFSYMVTPLGDMIPNFQDWESQTFWENLFGATAGLPLQAMVLLIPDITPIGIAVGGSVVIIGLVVVKKLVPMA